MNQARKYHDGCGRLWTEHKPEIVGGSARWICPPATVRADGAEAGAVAE